MSEIFYLAITVDNSVFLANMILSVLFSLSLTLRSALNGSSCCSYISEQRGSGAKEQRRYYISGPLQLLSPREVKTSTPAKVRGAQEGLGNYVSKRRFW